MEGPIGTAASLVSEIDRSADAGKSVCWMDSITIELRKRSIIICHRGVQHLEANGDYTSNLLD